MEHKIDLTPMAHSTAALLILILALLTQVARGLDLLGDREPFIVAYRALPLCRQFLDDLWLVSQIALKGCKMGGQRPVPSYPGFISLGMPLSNS